MNRVVLIREENIGAGSGQGNYLSVWVPGFKVLNRPFCERLAHGVFLFYCRPPICRSWSVLLELLIERKWNGKDGKYRGMDVRVFRFLNPCEYCVPHPLRSGILPDSSIGVEGITLARRQQAGSRLCNRTDQLYSYQRRHRRKQDELRRWHRVSVSQGR
jgi:hypothetical protein